MAAYYIEDALEQALNRIDTVFWVNRLNARRLIRTPADRERIRGRLLVAREDPLARGLFTSDPALAGGQVGSSYLEGSPIPHEIPETMRPRLFRDVLALGLPRTLEETLAHAQALDSAWSRERWAEVEQARDERVEELRRGEDSPWSAQLSGAWRGRLAAQLAALGIGVAGHLPGQRRERPPHPLPGAPREPALEGLPEDLRRAVRTLEPRDDPERRRRRYLRHFEDLRPGEEAW